MALKKGTYFGIKFEECFVELCNYYIIVLIFDATLYKKSLSESFQLIA